jgi:hypothetical protein
MSNKAFNNPHEALEDLKKIFDKWAHNHDIHMLALAMDDSDKTTIAKPSYIWISGQKLEMAVLLANLFEKQPDLEREVIMLRIKAASGAAGLDEEPVDKQKLI